MKNELILLWDRLRGSYWFIPVMMAVMTVILAHYAIQFDETTGIDIIATLDLAFIDSANGARAVLTIIASSMITIVGVVFSLTMVVFSLGAQQYGSFVLESFMRDRNNQLVLGSFTAAFIYSLLVLRTIREGYGNGKDEAHLEHQP